MIIRNMDIADYEAVYALFLATPGMGLNKTDDSKQGIEKYLKRNPATSFVAEEEGDIVGVLLCGHDGRRGYLHHMAVAPRCRERGIGTKLLDSALLALEKEGISKAALVVFAKNEIGNTFWQNRGFLVRGDLFYRNKNIQELERIDT